MRARPIVPGTRYKITRRCYEGRFFLLPTRLTTQIFMYWLGVCLRRYGIVLHAAVLMSNHYHLDVTDPYGHIVAFKRDFNAVLARALNASWGRYDKVFSGDPPCDVELVGDDDSVLESLVYTLTNPTQAGLVKSGRYWGGFTTWGRPFGSRLEACRPDVFFDKDNEQHPPSVEIEVVRPEVYAELTDEELSAELARRVRAVEHAKQDAMRREGQRFLGWRQVLRQRPTDTPAGPTERFGPRPRVSSRSRWAKLAALQRNRAWEKKYGACMDRYLAGERDVLFPYGTYWMRVYAGVHCHGPP